MSNPYQASELPADTPAVRKRPLWAIWLWLPAAAIGAMALAPADIISMALANAFALACFLVGVTLMGRASLASRGLRAGILIATALFIGLQVWFLGGLGWMLAGFAFAAINGWLGAEARRGLKESYAKIIGSLVAAYVVGMLAGPLGALLLPIPIVWLASRQRS